VKRRIPKALLAVLACCLCSFAQVRYSVSLTDPERHLVRVEVIIPSGRATHELQLPVWNALYQVRDFVLQREERPRIERGLGPTPPPT